MTTANPFITPEYQQHIETTENELILKDPQLRKCAGVDILDKLHKESTHISYQTRQQRQQLHKKYCQ